MCDVLVALPAATHGTTLFAKNSDRPPAERQVYEWVPGQRHTGPQRVSHIEVAPHVEPTLACLIARPAWMWGAEHGVNQAGVAIGNTTVYTRRDPRPATTGLTGMDLVRLALERATTAAQAVTTITGLIECYGQGGSGQDPAVIPGGRPYWNAFLVADPTAAFVIDTSGQKWAVEQVADVRAISNRTSIPGFDEAHRHPRQPVDRLVNPRWHAGQRLLAQRPVTVDGLMAHLRSHDTCGDPGWSVCMHADDVEATTASMIAELTPGSVRVHLLTGSPCTRDYATFDLADLPTANLAAV